MYLHQARELAQLLLEADRLHVAAAADTRHAHTYRLAKATIITRIMELTS